MEEYLKRHSQLWLVALCVAAFLLTYLAPVDASFSDPARALLTAQAIVEHGTIRLDAYVQDERYLNDPITPAANGHFYHYFPLGTPLAAVPAEWLASLRGEDMIHAEDNRALHSTREPWRRPGAEEGGQWRWSKSHRPSVLFRAAQPIAEAGELQLEIEAGTYQPQVIAVHVNGIAVGELRSERNWYPATYRLTVPARAIESAQRPLPRAPVFEVELDISGAMLVGEGSEQRLLGLCFRRLTLSAVEHP